MSAGLGMESAATALSCWSTAHNEMAGSLPTAQEETGLTAVYQAVGLGKRTTPTR